MISVLIFGRNQNVNADVILNDIATVFNVRLPHITQLRCCDANWTLALAVQEAATAMNVGNHLDHITWESIGAGGETIRHNGALFNYAKKIAQLANGVILYPSDNRSVVNKGKKTEIIITDKASQVLYEERLRLKLSVIIRKCDPAKVTDIMAMPAVERMGDDESRERGFPEGGGGNSTGNFDGEQEWPECMNCGVAVDPSQLSQNKLCDECYSEAATQKGWE